MKLLENATEKLIVICAIISTLSVLLITVFIFQAGLPILTNVGVLNFVFGTTWAPTNGNYGILPLIAGTISITIGALIIGVPTGIACAVFLAEI